MNPAFKSKYDQMREGKPTETEGEVPTAPTNGTDNNYSESGYIRNLCFVWPDGKMQFLNYSYLVSGEYMPQQNTILLDFTTHSVSLKGVNLDELFNNIMNQVVKKAICKDRRYNAIEDVSNKSILNEISIAEK